MRAERIRNWIGVSNERQKTDATRHERRTHGASGLAALCGPFTLALHLMSNDMFDDEDKVLAVIDYAAEAAIE